MTPDDNHDLVTEREIKLLNLIHAVNRKVATEPGIDTLLNQVCELLVADRSYYHALLITHKSDGQFDQLYSAGYDDSHKNLVTSLCREKCPDCFLEALNKPDEVTVIDVAHSCADCPFKAIHKDFVVLIGCLVASGVVKGLFSVAMPPDIFQSGVEVCLFEELLSDLSIALQNYDLRYQLQSELDNRAKIFEELELANHVLSSSPAVIFRWKNESEWPASYVSDNAEEILGYPPEAFVNGEIRFDQMVHPDDYQRVTEYVVACTNNPETDEFNVEPYRVIKKTGEVIWVANHTRIFRDDNQQTTHFHGVIIDITRQFVAEEKSQLQASMLDQISDWVVATDLEGRIKYINDAVCHGIGLQKSEIIGNSVVSLFGSPEGGSDSREQMILEKTLSDGVWRGIIGNPYSVKENMVLDLETSLLLGRDDKPVGAIGVARDVTEKSELELQLAQIQKQEQIGQLAGGIAHDFNNQLAGIMGYASALERRLDKTDLISYVKRIKDVVKRSAYLTSQLLAYSRQGKYRNQPVDMHEIVREIFNILKHSVDKKVAVKTLLKAENAVVTGDPDQL